MPKLMSEGICTCFNKAIEQSMFKHVASENGPLVLILQSYSQIFISYSIPFQQHTIWPFLWCVHFTAH